MGESEDGITQQFVRHSPRLHPRPRMDCDKVRIGDQYQANMDGIEYSPHEANSSLADRDQCVWCPSAAMNSNDLGKFLEWSKTERDIAEDKALYILLQSDYSIDMAKERLQQLVRRKISPTTMKIFKNGFQQSHRRFSIKQMKLVLPHCSSRRLVDLYCLAKGRGVRVLYNVSDFHWSTSKEYDLNQAKIAEQVGKHSIAIQKQITASNNNVTGSVTRRPLKRPDRKKTAQISSSRTPRKSNVIGMEAVASRHGSNGVTIRRSARLQSVTPINYSHTTSIRHTGISGFTNDNVQSSTSVSEANGGSNQINLKELLFMVYDIVDDYVVDANLSMTTNGNSRILPADCS